MKMCGCAQTKCACDSRVGVQQLYTLHSTHSTLHVGGLNSAREQHSSIGEDAEYVRLGAIHMEEEVQDRVSRRGREGKVKERHTERNKARNREATRNNQLLTMDGMRMR